MRAVAEPGPAGLRRLLAGDDLVVAPFVTDALQALVAEQAGAAAVYVTGFGTAAVHGLPDVGLIGLAEMVASSRRVAAAVSAPVIADGDTGYGNAVNVARTIAEHAAAGVAAVHIEDQVWPKRCGFFAGKEVVPVEEMVGKVAAAVEAAAGTGLVVIARTDALAPRGWDEVADRVKRFRDAGADLCFVDGLRTRADAETCAERLGAEVPLVYNGLLPVADVAALGFRLHLAIGTMLAGFDDLRRRMATLVATGTVDVDESVLHDLAVAVGLERADALRQRFETA